MDGTPWMGQVKVYILKNENSHTKYSQKPFLALQ